MAKVGKRQKNNLSKVDRAKRYTVDEAFKLILETSNAKFDESIDAAVKLGVDPKQSDQQVRGAIALPHGLGKKVRVLVFAKGPKEEEAKAAGADYIGSEDMVEKIMGGWLDFDKAIATPDMMKVISKAAKVLGPRGLMPNPKVGTVTMDIKNAVESEKKGKLDFRVEKAGIVHAGIGRRSLGEEKLKENFMTFFHALMKAKPASSKGIYMQSITLSSTMGPGIKIDISQTQSKVV